MATVSEQIAAIFEKLSSMEERLFMDNGNECLQSKVNRHGQMVETQEKRWKWICGTTTTLVIVILGRLIYDIVTSGSV